MNNIILPNDWTARPHQSPFMEYMFNGGTRAVCVWHRRAGKDSASLNFTVVEAHRHTANYWHMLPTAVQGRHVVWDSIDPITHIRVIDQVFPKEIRAGLNNTEMKIELKCGSTWQVVGSDNYDRLVGSNPRGVVFSEYSIADPRAWDFIRPILTENGGWAIFIYTSRGKNHGHDLYQMAKSNPDWFCELLDIDMTEREDGSPIITPKQYQAELDAGMDIQLAKQEFYCSFDAGLFGAYWTDALGKASYGSYPWNPRKPVHTFWDIGLDTTSIWFGQENGSAIDIIYYMSGVDVAGQKWCKEVNEMQFTYGSHTGPHDIKKRDWMTKVSTVSAAYEHGIDWEECPDIGRNAGIEAVRTFLPRCRFNTADHNSGVSEGVDGLQNYRREYNDKLRTWMDRPVHDWASHPADAFRYMSISWPDNFSMRGSQKFGVKAAVGNPQSRVTKRIRTNHG